MTLRLVAIPAVALLALAGCAGDTGPAGSLTDTSSPVYRIKTYYERNATEDLGRCTDLIFEDATEVETISDDEEQMVLQVRYAYSSASGREMDRNVSGCQGFGTRLFTLEKGADGVRVVDMSERIE